jgi:hypothetical protein
VLAGGEGGLLAAAPAAAAASIAGALAGGSAVALAPFSGGMASFLGGAPPGGPVQLLLLQAPARNNATAPVNASAELLPALGAAFASPTAPPRTPSSSAGSLSLDCSSLTWSDGSLWRAVGRCPVQFLRIRADPGTPLLALAALRVWDAEGNDLLPGAGAAASSADAALCAGSGAGAGSGGLSGQRAAHLTPAAQAAAGACAARLLNASAAAPFVSGAGDAAAGAWVQVDLGVAAPLSLLQLTRASAASFAAAALAAAGAASPAAAALAALGTPALDAALAAAARNLTIEGYGAAAGAVLSPVPPPGVTPEALRAAGFAPAFSLRLANWTGAAADDAQNVWSFSALPLSCGFLVAPSPSASGTPSPQPTPSPSGTTTASAAPTATPSVTPSATATGSGTVSATASRTASLTASVTQATPSITPSPTPSLSLSSTPLPLAYRSRGAPLTLAQQQGRAAADILAGEAGGAAASPPLPSGPFAWRALRGFTALTLLSDADFSLNLSLGAMAWEPFFDSGSGNVAAAVCWGSAPFECDAAAWSPLDAGALRAGTVDGAARPLRNVSAGARVFGTVAFVNGAGLASLATTDGVTLDDRPPLVGRVLDTGAYYLDPSAGVALGVSPWGSTAADIGCDEAGRGIGAFWGSGGASGAGLLGYEWSVGSVPGADAADVLPWTPLGLRVAVFNASLNPQPGAVVYVSVRANGVNGGSSVARSDGVRMLAPGGATGEGARLLCVEMPA